VQLGRVIGNVVCTAKDPSLAGKKLLLVQPVDRHGRDKGRALVAVDSVGAGAGETIYWCRGREASFPLRKTRHQCARIEFVDLFFEEPDHDH
jgi:ethanolamine utilization protein EutN